MSIEDSEPSDKSYETHCPVYLRLCDREACYSDLGCIEIRRAKFELDDAVHCVQLWLAEQRRSDRSKLDLTDDEIAQLLKAAYG